MTEQVPPSSSSPGLSSDWEPDVRLADLIDRTTVGAALHHATLTLFPIFASDGQSPPYDLLEDALARGTVVIREVSQAGHVPEVHIDNRGERPVLIIDGDVLVGAKQNRVANLSVLVPAKTQFVLPVSCVEAGRWYYLRSPFRGAVQCTAPLEEFQVFLDAGS